MIDIKPCGFVRLLLFLLSGPLIWFIHFNLIYGAAGFGDALGISSAGVRLFAWGATLAAIAAVIAMLRIAQGSRAPFNRESHYGIYEMMRSLAALSLMAVMLEALVLWVISL